MGTHDGPPPGRGPGPRLRGLAPTRPHPCRPQPSTPDRPHRQSRARIDRRRQGPSRPRHALARSASIARARLLRRPHPQGSRPAARNPTRYGENTHPRRPHSAPRRHVPLAGGGDMTLTQPSYSQTDPPAATRCRRRLGRATDLSQFCPGSVASLRGVRPTGGSDRTARTSAAPRRGTAL